MKRQWKAFDFLTGHTYLIGEHDSKADAKAYCIQQGFVTISQTLVPLTEEEYQSALKNTPREKYRMKRS